MAIRSTENRDLGNCLGEALLPPGRGGCLGGCVGRHGPGCGERGLGLVVSRGEVAVTRTDEAHPAVAVVARAVFGHGAVVDHG